MHNVPQHNTTVTITRTSTPMYDGVAPTPAFTPKQHVVDIRPESQQTAAAAPSPQATYPRTEKHGTGNILFHYTLNLSTKNLNKNPYLIDSMAYTFIDRKILSAEKQ